MQKGEVLWWERSTIEPEFDSFGIDVFGIKVCCSFEEID